MPRSESDRAELRERDYPNGDLLREWSLHCSAIARSVDQATQPADLVDGIRSANLRLGESRRRQHSLGNGQYQLPADQSMDLSAFQHFESVWGTIKYSSMIKALEWRSHGDRSVKANIVESDIVPGEEILVVSIDGKTENKGKPYKTETALRNIEPIMTSDQLKTLVGIPDNLPRGNSPKHTRGAQVLHRT